MDREAAAKRINEIITEIAGVIMPAPTGDRLAELVAEGNHLSKAIDRYRPHVMSADIDTVTGFIDGTDAQRQAEADRIRVLFGLDEERRAAIRKQYAEYYEGWWP